MSDLRRIAVVCLLLALSWLLPAPGSAGEEAVPDADAQVSSLEEMCAATSEARAGRHEAKPLFHRLGGQERIHALTQEIVRLHRQNEAIQHLLEGVDDDHLAQGVAQFMISGLGGPSVYKGPSLSDSHRHMKLTNADFMAAGGDVVQAMKNLEYGQNEIDEVVCTLVALRDQVVLSDEQAAAHAH